jgi:hypothetical protein
MKFAYFQGIWKFTTKIKFNTIYGTKVAGAECTWGSRC